jgi:hypothetical protein
MGVTLYAKPTREYPTLEERYKIPLCSKARIAPSLGRNTSELLPLWTY